MAFYYVAAVFCPPFQSMSRIVDRSFCLTSWWIPCRAVRSAVSYILMPTCSIRVDKVNIMGDLKVGVVKLHNYCTAYLRSYIIVNFHVLVEKIGARRR